MRLAELVVSSELEARTTNVLPLITYVAEYYWAIALILTGLFSRLYLGDVMYNVSTTHQTLTVAVKTQQILLH